MLQAYVKQHKSKASMISELKPGVKFFHYDFDKDSTTIRCRSFSEKKHRKKAIVLS